METAETSKLEMIQLGENMGTQKISVSDHINRFHRSNEESDKFVIEMEMENFSNGRNKENSGNPRITRNVVRKGFQCGNEKKIIPNSNANQRLNSINSAIASSPKAAQIGAGAPEKPVLVTATDHCSSNQPDHHQITITTTTTTGERKCVTRRNSFRRTSPWSLDPKRVMFIFATLSSMGTIILIYFTLSIAKQQ